ncbi:MAG TPA: tetratricopeptide repeat protein [Myxococcota bacterium]|jgi:tol-pal system protein YbgF|nr:tetratricopeptide repeat protein [Myxococcota bacterium]
MASRHHARALAAVAAACVLGGCVSMAEFRELEYEVNRLKGARGGATAGSRAQPGAEAQTELEALREEVRALEGRVEVAEHQLAQTLETAQAGTRGAVPAPQPDATAAAPDRSAEPGEPAGEAPEPFEGSPEEVQAYRDARAAWRVGDLEACIDRFREFLQTYPASDHADDAAYWMADCHYREGDYKAAVLRFADVVQRYPAGDKAADALYRQGEALLRLGPKYGSAAETAFERLIDEYPDSPRVAEARRQLELLGPGGAAGGGNEG